MTKNIVLIHGAWHMGKCWNPIRKSLEEKGYNVYTPTYPGNGDGKSKNIVPQDYIDWIQGVISDIDGKVIVLGHSSAGIIMVGGLPGVKDKVELAIFNNAFVPPHGMSQFDVVGPEIEAIFRSIAGSREDGCVVLDEGFIRGKLMQLSDEATFQRLLDEEVVPQPIAIFDTKVQTKEFIDSGIPCAMIHCKDDVSVDPDGYKMMFQSIGRGEIVEIPGEHELLVSNPDAIVDALMQILEA